MTPNHFVLFAQPWWVNLCILVPFLCYALWRRGGLAIARQVLVYSAIFGLAFGFVEASVVVYIRAAVGMLPGFNGTLADVVRESAPLYRQPLAVHQLPPALLSLETLRESATIIMLVSVALLAATKRRERWQCSCGASPGGIWRITQGCGRRFAGHSRCNPQMCCSLSLSHGWRRCGSRF